MLERKSAGAARTLTTRRMLRIRLAWLTLVACLLSVGLALARPGGGQEYSGKSRSSDSSSSSSSSSDSSSSSSSDSSSSYGDRRVDGTHQNNNKLSTGGKLLVLLAFACIPGAKLLQIMIERKKRQTPPEQLIAKVQVVEHQARGARRALEALRNIDPEFSLVLFEDFVYMMYQAVRRSRVLGTGPLAAYLSPDLARTLPDPALSDVHGIVIGAIHYTDFPGINHDPLRVAIEIEANFVEVDRIGEQRRWYAKDCMVLTRSRTARSRPFARAHSLDCPNCGAPLDALRGTQCSYCRQDVGFGRFDWMVERFANLERELRKPLFISDTAETGTNLPTLVDADAAARFQELQARDPALTWPAFTARIAHVFATLQVAWSSRNPQRVRPFVSDNLFQMLYYWSELYKASFCRNVTEGARILRVDLASVTSDKHYDAVTVRLFATSIDYTIDSNDKLLSGSRSDLRTYSEYWTWIRGSTRKGPSRGDLACPNCGAALRIGMSGHCEHCKIKVTAGEFDWVLSRIEQDDSYAG